MSVEIFYDKVLTIYRGLDTEQRRILKERIVKEDGDATVSFTKSAPAKKKKGGWRAVKPYWMKSLEAFDASKKGAECIVGEYFMEVRDQIGRGEKFVIGCRNEPKVYYFCERSDGEELLFMDAGKTYYELKDAKALARCDSFKELKEKLKEVY